jgi:hypothetical protein
MSNKPSNVVKINGNQLVLIEWNDCESGEGWYSQLAVDEYCQRPLAIMKSIGWLLFENDDWVVVAQSLGEEDPEVAGDLLKVPKVMIRKKIIVSLPNDDNLSGEG